MTKILKKQHSIFKVSIESLKSSIYKCINCTSKKGNKNNSLNIKNTKGENYPKGIIKTPKSVMFILTPVRWLIKHRLCSILHIPTVSLGPPQFSRSMGVVSSLITPSVLFDNE